MLVLIHGLRATSDLDWPHDPDLYRDISQAQTMRDGALWADPFYLDETLWYNPLVPGTVAAVSWLTGQPVHRVHTRLGAYLNVLAPLTFYILLACLFDRWTALAGTLGFLFVVGARLPAWASATYSPWLFTAVFTQSLFYLTLVTYLNAVRREDTETRAIGAWRSLGAGLLLGLTFLGHTAPAIIAGAMIGLTTLHSAIASPRAGRAIANAALIVVTALIVSAPFLYSIVGRYRLAVLNPAPARWGYYDPAIADVWTPVSVLVAIGIVAAVRWTRDRAHAALWVWPAVCLGFLGYAYLGHLMEIRLPSVVPAVHFLFYLKAFEALLFGCGLILVSQFLGRAYGMERVVAGALLLITFVIVYPSYESREAFTASRIRALSIGESADQLAAFSWIREHTQPHEVFLVSDDIALFVVGPSGRKVVAVGESFSNPYVDWQARATARDLMFADLLSGGDGARFRELAGQYRVAHVVLLANEVEQGRLPTFVLPEFASGAIRILRISVQGP